MCASACVLALVVSVRAQGPLPPATPAKKPHRDAPLFVHSDNCMSCHNNLMTGGGEDVSIGVSWQSTIMANAARDPYFHASVRRETIDHSSKAAEIQHECAACHVPIAQKMAHAEGRLASTLSQAGPHEATEDERLAKDGVSCTVCHQVASDGLGTRASFNGNFVLRPTRPDAVREIFGPFAVDPGRQTIMRSVTGFEQVAAPHVRQSELCASCHTLITQAFGPDGKVIGSLPEQMNFQEWKHSAFYDESRSCQSCHMPRAEGPIRVSSVLGAERDGLSRHAFVGGNAFMLRLMNRFRGALGVEAPAAQMEATARLTERQLREATATVAVSPPGFSAASVVFDVTVRNLAGHKYPTGYPSRRSWLHVTVRDASRGVVFESGAITATGLIDGNDSDADASRYEPHYATIDGPGQVQIYEAILGDANGRPTTGLLSAVRYLKDNRLLPRGFDKAKAESDIAVYGGANNDPDFAGGGDRVRYQIPLPEGRGTYTIEVELRFQAVGYRWAHNLEPYDASEPRAFLKYFQAMSSSASSLVQRATAEARR
jgi:Cytochrome c554 and c-prime